MRPAPGIDAKFGLLLLAAITALCWWLRCDDQALPELGRYRDDAYYYFCQVRNLWTGLGPVVSDVTPTSGVHVAWTLALLPLYGLFGDVGLIEGARFLGLGLLVAAAAAMGLLLRREGVSRRMALVGALVLAATPALLDEAQNGQETALGCFALLLLMAARDRRPLVFVAASLFAVAARSDLILFVGCLSLVRPEPWWRRLILPLPALCAYAGWNWLLAGHLVQDSAMPMAWLAHHQLAGLHGGGVAELWWWGRPCLLGEPFARFGVMGSAALVALALPLRGYWRLLPLLAVVVALFGGVRHLMVPTVAAGLLALQPAVDRQALRPSRAMLLAAVALVALHWLWRWYPRDYYLAPLGVAGVWALARYAAAAAPPLRMLVLVGVGLELSLSALAPLPQRPWQEAMLLAGRHVDQVVGEGEAIGSFNSGIIAWHRKGAVVNLDGVVSRPAFEALRRGEVGARLDELGVAYLCDNEIQFLRQPGELHACGEFFAAEFEADRDLVELVRYLGTGAGAGRPATDSFRLYSRNPRMPRPAAAAFEDLGARPGGGRWLAWRGAEGEQLWARSAAGEQLLAEAVAGVLLVLTAPAAVDGPVSVYTSDGREQLLIYPR